MKRTSVLLAVVLTLVLSLAVVAYAAEAETGDAFDPEALVVGGVALAPLISVLISILKGWVNLDSKYIPLINVILGAVAVLVVGVVNEGMSLASAIIMTLGVVLGSQVFHETFGHAGKILQEIFKGKQQDQAGD